jgi:uncharacterized protein
MVSGLVISPRDQEQLSAICSRFAVQRLSLFGSFLFGQANSSSDLDLLVEFAPGESPGLFELGELQQDLSALFRREVDLKTPRFLSAYFRDQVVAEAKLLYAA